jgi:photosystem II stability/assembly factor-like uncharacterized protein
MNRAFFSVLLSISVVACSTVQQPTQQGVTPSIAKVDANARWFKLPTEPFKGKQDDAYFVNPQLGFYVNGLGKIYRTQDGGQHWDVVLNQPGTYFRAIGMVDSLHGFAGNIGTDYFPGVTDTNPLYETHDGGNSWQVVAGLPGAPVKGICAIDILPTRFINAGVLDERTLIHAGGRVGSPASLLRSLDGGKSWTHIDMSAWVAMIVDVKFFDAMHGIVFAGSDADVEKSHALIVTTQDGGKTWQKAYESTRPFELTWKGAFANRQVGFATVQNYNPDKSLDQRYVLKTADGGKTWAELPLVKDFAVREFGIGFATPELGWVGTSKGGFETRNGGATWEPVELGRAVNKIRILQNGNSLNAYAIGADLYQFAVPTANTHPQAAGMSESVPIVKP